MLSGGDPRSLGNTNKVVELVLSNQSKLDELMNTILSNDDAIVRMRASDAIEKICKQKPLWFAKYKSELLGEWPKIQQPSVQWHLAQILSEIELTHAETILAIGLVKKNLELTDDWIVENLSLETLAIFVRRNQFDRREFITIINRYENCDHKSVVSRVRKLQKEFDLTK